QPLHRSGDDIVRRQTQRRNGDTEALTDKPQRQLVALGPCDDADAGALRPELSRFASQPSRKTTGCPSRSATDSFVCAPVAKGWIRELRTTNGSCQRTRALPASLSTIVHAASMRA